MPRARCRAAAGARRPAGLDRRRLCESRRRLSRRARRSHRSVPPARCGSCYETDRPPSAARPLPYASTSGGSSKAAHSRTAATSASGSTRRSRDGRSRARPTTTVSPSCRSSAASARPGWDPDATGAVTGLTFDDDAGRPAPRRRSRASPSASPRSRSCCPRSMTLSRAAEASARIRAGSRSWPTRSRRPVTASAVEEASLRGAAVAILERSGYEPAEAPLGEVFQPQAARAEAYRTARERQQRLYEELRGKD